MTELKPCPFCGSIPQCGVEFYESRGTEIKLAATVKCPGCGIIKGIIFKATDKNSYVPFCDYDNAFEEVVQAWNRRNTNENLNRYE